MIQTISKLSEIKSREKFTLSIVMLNMHTNQPTVKFLKQYTNTNDQVIPVHLSKQTWTVGLVELLDNNKKLTKS